MPRALEHLGKPNLYFGVTAGNMDSMINRYTADRRLRHDDAYTAGDLGGKRPDRAVTVYTQKCREAFADVPVVAGGIEASLRRLAHYDYWSESVKRSVLIDSTADILLYGNAERAMVDLTHRLAKGENIRDITDLRGSAFMCRTIPEGWREIDSTSVDQPGRLKNKKIPTRCRSLGQCRRQRDSNAVMKAETCASAESAAWHWQAKSRCCRLFPTPRRSRPIPAQPIFACRPLMK